MDTMTLHLPRSVADCRLLTLPEVVDSRGNLTYVEGGRQLPFQIKRVYFLSGVPGDARRAGHMHRSLQQVLLAASGSFNATIDDGTSRAVFHMNQSNLGLYIPPMLWLDLDSFTSGTVCMALASDWFDESDYVRDYATFKELASKPSL